MLVSFMVGISEIRKKVGLFKREKHFLKDIFWLLKNKLFYHVDLWSM